MRSRTRATKWNLFFHYASIGLMMISGVILVPLYLKFISIGLYGAWLATGNVLMWLTALDPGLSTVIQQRVGAAYGNKDISAIGRTIPGGVALALIFSLAILIAGGAASFYIADIVHLANPADSDILQKAFMLA